MINEKIILPPVKKSCMKTVPDADVVSGGVRDVSGRRKVGRASDDPIRYYYSENVR
jgi:hypothetical protein